MISSKDAPGWRAAAATVAATLALASAVAGCGDDRTGGDRSNGDPVETSAQLEVVLVPVSDADDQVLRQAADIVADRAAELGEASVTVRDQQIAVTIIGTDDQERATELLPQTGELRFRPVLTQIPVDQIDAAREASTSTTAAPPGGAPTTTVAPAAGEGEPSEGDPFAVTDPDDDTADATVNLEDKDGTNLYSLGPTLSTGKVVASANARLDPNGVWSVALEMHGGADGIDLFNQVAAQCNPASQVCPTGQLAIVLDSVVQSAPTISESSYTKDQIQISGDFSESEAKDLALVLGSGSLPIELRIESTTSTSTSPDD